MRLTFAKVLVAALISLACAFLLVTGSSARTACHQGAAYPSVSPTPPPAEPAEDVIRIKTNLVQLDVVVLDNDGRQVRDLTAFDFKIIDNGRTRVPEYRQSWQLTRLL